MLPETSCAGLSSLCCELGGEREEDAERFVRNRVPKDGRVGVAAEHIIWDQKPEASPQALLLICWEETSISMGLSFPIC